MSRIKISAVSYYNTFPFLYGIEQSGFLSTDSYLLQTDYPASCAQKLINDEVDLGLIPVAVIPKLKQHHIISDWCIGAVGEVLSVKLFSHCPLEEIEAVYLDYQSQTSIKLIKILFKYYWKREVRWLEGKEGYEQKINGKTAGLIIGDRAISLYSNYTYQYDLAKEWVSFSHLPFVFALWVSNKELPDDFIRAFNKALNFGVHHIEQSITYFEKSLNSPKAQIVDYLKNNISFPFDSEKKKGLERFLELAEGV